MGSQLVICWVAQQNALNKFQCLFKFRVPNSLNLIYIKKNELISMYVTLLIAMCPKMYPYINFGDGCNQSSTAYLSCLLAYSLRNKFPFSNGSTIMAYMP